MRQPETVPTGKHDRFAPVEWLGERGSGQQQVGAFIRAFLHAMSESLECIQQAGNELFQERRRLAGNVEHLDLA